jgi:hydrogenase maturation factor
VPLVRFTTFNIGTVARRTIIKDVAIEGTPPSPITPTVSFVLAEQSKEEDAGDMVVTVQLTAATSKTVTVPFVVDGSATAGVDHTATSSPVVITPGETL